MRPVPEAVKEGMERARECRTLAGPWGLVGYAGAVHDAIREETRATLARLRALRGEEVRNLLGARP